MTDLRVLGLSNRITLFLGQNTADFLVDLLDKRDNRSPELGPVLGLGRFWIVVGAPVDFVHFLKRQLRLVNLEFVNEPCVPWME